MNFKMNHLGKSVVGISLCLSMMLTGSALASTPTVHAATASATTSASSKANAIISFAKQFMGVRYQFGSPSGYTKSFDCSSFTQYVFKKYGVSLPRDSRQQSKVGTYVPKDQLKPGDLVFFYSPIHHVGIYIGNGKMINTWGKPGVTITDINSGWWKTHYTTARRVL